jgi:hypothetical protein
MGGAWSSQITVVFIGEDPVVFLKGGSSCLISHFVLSTHNQYAVTIRRGIDPFA